jgi:UDP-glucose 4-epimerase
MHHFVTGGAGFVGSHLAERLLNDGHSVTIIDDLSTGSMRNIAHLRGENRFRYVIDTVMNERLLAELVDEADVIHHLAAAVGVRLIVDSPVRTIETNIGCTDLVLRCAEKKRKRVLIASTSEVYGKSADLPYREEGDLVLGATTRGRWSYACSKAIDEFLAISFWRERKVPTTVVRLFNTVGPRQSGRYGMVIPRFVEQALAGRPLTVYGDGTQSRCFTHVVDVVDAIVRLMRSETTVGEVYNIGSSEEITINDLAQRIIRLVGSSSRVVHIPFAEAYEENFEDMTRRVPALEKIGAAVGWTPQRDLEAILESVVAFEHAARVHDVSA